MDINEVKTFIESNQNDPEVQSYIGGFITPDRVNSFLESDAGKQLLQPTLDKYHHKGLESWKEKNLPKFIEEEINKRYPAETEEQKELRKLKSENEAMKLQMARESMKTKAMSLATQKGLPSDIIDYFVANDENGTMENLTKLETVWQAALQAAVEAKFKEGGRLPGHNKDSDKELMNKKFSEMTMDEKSQLYELDPELYRRLRDGK